MNDANAATEKQKTLAKIYEKSLAANRRHRRFHNNEECLVLSSASMKNSKPKKPPLYNNNATNTVSISIAPQSIRYNNPATKRNSMTRKVLPPSSTTTTVTNHPTSAAAPLALSNLVNKLGYPDGMGTTSEETRGPYLYVLAVVTRVHFDEDVTYYTVRRQDTFMEFRADAVDMLPIEGEGLEAARMAAENTTLGIHMHPKKRREFGKSLGANFVRVNFEHKSIFRQKNGNNNAGDQFLNFNSRACCRGFRNFCIEFYLVMIKMAEQFLKGKKPFFCSLRLTGVNIFVLCSFWFSFVDQLILSFPSPTYDRQLNITSCVVWCILVWELMLEVFIRPDGYVEMLKSEKSYSPITRRYVDRFHLFFEFVSLAIFFPNILSFFNPSLVQEQPLAFSLPSASLMAAHGPSLNDFFLGRFYYLLIRFRIFGLLRHWKKFVNSNLIMNPDQRSSYAVLDFSNTNGKGHRHPDILRKHLLEADGNFGNLEKHTTASSEKELQHSTTSTNSTSNSSSSKSEKRNSGAAAEDEATFREKQLVNATTIGTALMTINSHRAMIFAVMIAGIVPILVTFYESNGQLMVNYLQDTNLAITTNSTADCEYLRDSIAIWLLDYNVAPWSSTDPFVYVLWLQILPVRCPFQNSESGVITSDICLNSASFSNPFLVGQCHVWANTDHDTLNSELARRADIRVAAIETFQSERVFATYIDGSVGPTEFFVSAKFNENWSTVSMNFNSFILQLMLFLALLFGLEVLRLDAGRLVLNPFRRMLKIVSLYAKKPLAPPPKERNQETEEDFDSSEEAQLGKYETEQLINAITKITDLLRKCWGVAGAGIISANLARQADGTTAELNPCVPGTRVYALFSFAALCNFDYVLKNLGADILILINDVANVLHGEVYRWGFGESGQCNKNLGSAFLFVFRIGAAKDVHEKKEKATEVIFSTSSFDKKRQSIVNSKRVSKRLEKQLDTAVQLHSLPGIQEFTDRAVIGLLKCFAGLYRNDELLKWGNDFRLGLAGGSNFSVDMVFGMHAGWAVEGAVGSEYKIDATYLSPHVNMAARMMTACKQYGVSILLTEAIEQLMSEPAREKLRHIDTVTVKGSSVPQRIYTYDMRHKGVNFFLFERSSDQADIDSDRYSPLIWYTDQDLLEMRQHVTPNFEDEFKKGIKDYLEANWLSAYDHLKAANQIMIENVYDMGYINGVDGDEVTSTFDEKDEECDGPSQNLMSYIEKHRFEAPKNWKGYRALTSK